MRRDTLCLGAIALATCLVSYNSLQYLSRSLTPSEGAYLDGTADEQVVRHPIVLTSKGNKRGSGRQPPVQLTTSRFEGSPNNRKAHVQGLRTLLLGPPSVTHFHIQSTLTLFRVDTALILPECMLADFAGPHTLAAEWAARLQVTTTAASRYARMTPSAAAQVLG